MVDDAIVVDKLRHINEYTNDLKEMRGLSGDEYVDDVITQRAVERTFLTLIQSCIDLARLALEPVEDQRALVQCVRTVLDTRFGEGASDEGEHSAECSAEQRRLRVNPPI